MPKLEQFEIKKYWQIFSGLKPVENKVDHNQVVPILYNSKLDSSILNKIWFLADIDDDDNLDFEEFVICMRLVFDMVNKNIDKVPDELPDWLIPGSKAKLVKEKKERKQKENADLPKVQNPEVDYYISPEDKKLYDGMLASITSSTDGTYTLEALMTALKSKFFNIGTSDYNKIWDLVNPKRRSSIDKDPAVLFIHILRQKNDLNCNTPTELPKSLADICNRDKIAYDLNSSQNEVRRSSAISSSSNTNYNPNNMSSNYKPIKVPDIPRGSINDPASMERELDALDVALGHIREEISKQQNTTLIRQQFEELLRYKEQQYQKSKQMNASSSSVNIRTITDDVNNIEQQVSVLENYLNDKKIELNQLQSQITSSNP